MRPVGVARLTTGRSNGGADETQRAPEPRCSAGQHHFPSFAQTNVRVQARPNTREPTRPDDIGGGRCDDCLRSNIPPPLRVRVDADADADADLRWLSGEPLGASDGEVSESACDVGGSLTCGDTGGDLLDQLRFRPLRELRLYRQEHVVDRRS